MNTFKNKPFAALCYRYRSIEELQRDLKGLADAEDCEAWDLTAKEWREQVKLALKTKMKHDAA